MRRKRNEIRKQEQLSICRRIGECWRSSGPLKQLSVRVDLFSASVGGMSVVRSFTSVLLLSRRNVNLSSSTWWPRLFRNSKYHWTPLTCQLSRLLLTQVRAWLLCSQELPSPCGDQKWWNPTQVGRPPQVRHAGRARSPREVRSDWVWWACWKFAPLVLD